MSNHEVGYGKPPIEHRFKKGHTLGRNGRRGNRPKVRPDNSAAAILKRIDEELIEVNGQKMTKIEAEYRVLQAKAIKGDMKAATLLDRKRQAAGLLKPAVGGGVLLLPSTVPLHEWEASAAIQQAQYRERTG